MKGASTILIAIGAWALCGAAGAAAERPSGEKILDQYSYWRSHYTLRPARYSLGLWKKEGRDPASLKSDMRFLRYPFNGHWARSAITSLAVTPPPPAGWEKAGFNDSTWSRMRNPMLMGCGGGPSVFAVGSSCHRARFFVKDAARSGKLVLTVKYRGGIVVWLNGTEIGRGHLPPGPVNPDVGATEYTEAEYVIPAREDLPAEIDPKGKFKGKPRCIIEISEDFQQTKVMMRRSYQFAAPITPEENADLMRRRNRKLGPIELPAKLLRKGVNVLAVRSVRSDLHPCIRFGKKRLGPAAHYGWTGMYGGHMWLHGGVQSLRLDAVGGGADPERRPRGVQLWAESVHRRVFSPEFGDPGKPGRVLRMVGGRGGTYSAQLVLGTDRQLGGPSAVVSDLAGPGGAKIPASAVEVRFAAGRPLRALGSLGVERSPRGGIRWPLSCSSAWRALERHCPRDNEGRLGIKLPDSPPGTYNRIKLDAGVEKAMDEIRFFDELAPRSPASIPANSCQPVWVTVKVPADAAPGLYAGKLTVKGSGFGPEEVPVRLAVMDVEVPDPAKGRDFTSVVAMEQSPWGVARAYKCAPWSDEHFAHIEKSLRRMAELGNDYYILPVLLGSEFGNREDSFVTWVRRRDGKLDCDFSRVDRYLDLVQKVNPKPLAVCFGVAHPPENNLWVVPRVLLRDEAAGKTEPFTVPMGKANPFKRGAKVEFTEEDRAAAREFWRPFVAGVLQRMKKRGIEKSLLWGYVWDYTLSLERYQSAFEELAPGVKWARGSHGHGGVKGKQGFSGPFGLLGTIVCLPQPVKRVGRDYAIESHRGWKGTDLHLALPRTQNAVLCVEGHSAPYYWRLFPELAFCGGARGICRVGADYWGGTCQDGWRGGGQVGIGVVCTFWPGEKRANSSARFEMLREGLQEAEMRVVLEKALEGSPAGGKAWRAMLDERITATLHLMRSYYNLEPAEQDFGWQERSWDLYAAAAAAGRGRPLSAADRKKFFGD
ncbi:MAG: glycoside hydrolase domain-containing protein [Planctomycetota bacterium]|jgi:hypothetical protein